MSGKIIPLKKPEPACPAPPSPWILGEVFTRDGVDYELVGRSLVFPRPIAQEGKLGFVRWTAMWLGIAGSYRKHETVDVVYQAGGRRQVATGLQPQPFG